MLIHLMLVRLCRALWVLFHVSHDQSWGLGDRKGICHGAPGFPFCDVIWHILVLNCLDIYNVQGIPLVKLPSVQHSLILEWGLLVEAIEFWLVAHLWVVVYTLRIWRHVWLRGLWEERHSRVLDKTYGILGGVSYAWIFRLEAHLSFNCHVLDLELICLCNDELLIPPVLPLLSAASRILFNLPQLLLRFIIHPVIIFLGDHLLWGCSHVCTHAMMSIRELY